MAKTDQFFSGEQGDLLRQLDDLDDLLHTDTPPDLDIADEFRGAMSFMLREANKRGISRDRIVDRMNMCLPEKSKAITKRKLDSWMARSKEDHPFPAVYLPALSWACTGMVASIEIIVRAVGMHLISDHELLAKELGEVAISKSQLGKQERHLRFLATNTRR